MQLKNGFGFTRIPLAGMESEGRSKELMRGLSERWWGVDQPGGGRKKWLDSGSSWMVER